MAVHACGNGSNGNGRCKSCNIDGNVVAWKRWCAPLAITAVAATTIMKPITMVSMTVTTVVTVITSILMTALATTAA
jgi:hypothetical protein